MGPDDPDPYGWVRCPLGDLVDERGITYGIVQPGAPADTGVPIIRVNNFSGNRLSLHDPLRVDPEIERRYGRSRLRGGEVLITLVGSVGLVAVAPPDTKNWNVARAVGVIPLKPGIPPRWVAWCLQHPSTQDVMRQRLNTTVQHTLNLKDLASITIPLPPSNVIDMISALLEPIDRKLELNRQMNQTLRSLIAALFARMMEADDGWKAVPIGNAVSVCGGGTPSTADPRYWDNGHHAWVTPKDLSRLTDPVLLSTERRVTDAGLSRISSGLLPPGTVLLSSRAPIGYTAITEIPVAINQGFIAMTCDALPNYYVWQWTLANMEAIKARANGSTFQEISKANFRPMLIPVPPREVLDSFVAAVAPLHHLMVANVRQSSSLVQLRDALLPEVISGRMPLRDSDAAVGATL